MERRACANAQEYQSVEAFRGCKQLKWLFISHPCEVGHEDVFSSDCSGQGRELVFVAESERHRHVTAVSKRAV